VFYLAYDTSFLYLAMRSPLEAGRSRRRLRPDDDGVLRDGHPRFSAALDRAVKARSFLPE
jgi:hypothetical protein